MPIIDYKKEIFFPCYALNTENFHCHAVNSGLFYPMKLSFLIIVAVIAATITLPTATQAALSFDLWENMNNPGGRFYGYSTRSVGAAEDGNFDRSGERASGTSPGVTQSISFDSAGDITYTSTNPNSFDIGTSFVDIDLTNSTDPLGAATYGIDAINEFVIYYDLEASFTGGIAGVNAYWFFPGSDTSVDSTDGFLLGLVATGVGRSLSFQSEDLYAQSGRAPLLLNGETGTLRFEFSSAATSPTGGSGSVNLSNIVITAIVPEPSSALLLTGVLGLFGSTFRRRRKLAVA